VGQLPYFAGFLVVAFPLGLAGCLALLRWRQIRGISRRHTADRVLAVGAALLGAAIALGGVEAYFLAGYLEEHSRFSFRYSVELQPVGMGTARILVPIPSDEGLSQLIALENATGGITTVNNDRVLEVFLEGRALATAVLTSHARVAPAMTRTSPPTPGCLTCTSSFAFYPLTGNLTGITVSAEASWGTHCMTTGWEAGLTLLPGEREYPVEWWGSVC